ncbi:efflux RND transporter periplasmic adaptor subunit [bacterium]|nr:efflux RND transporter periplasmic adaptor subunit [bacterium]
MKEWISKRTRWLLPLAVIGVGLLAMIAIANTRKPPQHSKPEVPGALVNVEAVEMANRTILVRGDGTVTPRFETSLSPQVSGKVVWVHPNFVAGGAFNKGDVLLKVDPTDFELALQQARSAVAQAEYQLELTRANADIALREWESMQKSRAALNGQPVDSTTQPDALVLQKPQLKQAEAAYSSAQASLEMAQLNLDRTQLRAPFNARIRNISAAPGQLVGPNGPVARLYSTDIVEIPVGISVADLGWIEVPGSKARVHLSTGQATWTWEGTVDRTLGVVDEIGRLAQVVVRVEHPFTTSGTGQPELSIGSFVRVEIEGRQVQHVMPVPRIALRDNNTVWVADKENNLEIRSVSLRRLTPDEALVEKGLEVGDRVVLTQISGAANGMKLRPMEEEFETQNAMEAAE